MRTALTARPVLGLVALPAWYVLAMCCVLAAPLAAQEPQLALDSGGTVYRLVEGTYAKLFGDGAAADPGNPVLALDVISASGISERWLVPGTETRDPDASSTLLYENATQRVYLLWQTYYGGLHPFFHLVSFDGAAWSEVIQIGGALFTERGSPQLIITRDAAGDDEEDRTILHLAWWESVPGTSRKLYTPILIKNGKYIGSSPLIDLASFPSAGEEPLPSAEGLEDAIAMRRGRNGQTVVLGFLNPATHRLVTLEVELLPRALNQLADDVRAQIVLIGLTTPPTRDELVESVRSKLLEVGTSFHETTRGYLADQVAEIVRSSPQELTPEGIAAIADQVRAQIVLIGSRIRVAGLMDFSESEILELGPSASGRYHYLNASMVSDRAAPEVGGPADLFLSESGRNVIVAWEEDGRIQYRESLGDEWSEAEMIEITEDLDRAAVYRMLEERVPD